MVLDQTAGYPLQRCWCSVTPRFLHSGVAVAEPADSTFRWSRRARGRTRISDTRVFRAPAVTKLGTGLSVERDMADRPVHDRTRARDGRAFSSRGARKSLGCLVDPITSRRSIVSTQLATQTESTESRHDVRGERTRRRDAAHNAQHSPLPSRRDSLIEGYLSFQACQVARTDLMSNTARTFR
jgi:hypothetical protein